MSPTLSSAGCWRTDEDKASTTSVAEIVRELVSISAHHQLVRHGPEKHVLTGWMCMNWGLEALWPLPQAHRHDARENLSSTQTACQQGNDSSIINMKNQQLVHFSRYPDWPGQRCQKVSNLKVKRCNPSGPSGLRAAPWGFAGGLVRSNFSCVTKKHAVLQLGNGWALDNDCNDCNDCCSVKAPPGSAVQFSLDGVPTKNAGSCSYFLALAEWSIAHWLAVFDLIWEGYLPSDISHVCEYDNIWCNLMIHENIKNIK